MKNFCAWLSISYSTYWSHGTRFHFGSINQKCFNDRAEWLNIPSQPAPIPSLAPQVIVSAVVVINSWCCSFSPAAAASLSANWIFLYHLSLSLSRSTSIASRSLRFPPLRYFIPSRFPLPLSFNSGAQVRSRSSHSHLHFTISKVLLEFMLGGWVNDEGQERQQLQIWFKLLMILWGSVIKAHAE